MLTTSLWSSQIKYFKNYRINEWDMSVIGSDSLTETKAFKTKCNRFIYDSTGTLTQIEGIALGLNFYDSKEEVAKIKFKYQGSSIFMFFLDNKNNPMANKKGNVFGKEIVKLKDGYQLYFLNEEGKRTTNRHFIYLISNKIDRTNNIIEKQFYDANNNPIQNSERVFKIQNRYNKEKQLIETKYYNKNDKLTKNILNFAIIKYGYDKYGELVEKRYLDTKRNPAATFPFKISSERKINNRRKYFDRNNNPIMVTSDPRFKTNEPDPINYDLVAKLNTQDLLENIVSLGVQSSQTFSYDINIKSNITDSLALRYLQRWHSMLDSLEQEGKIFQDSRTFYTFSSIDKEVELINKLTLMSEDSIKRKIKEIFLLTDKTSYNTLNKYSDPAARFCYGQLRVNEIVFFQWQDILFCVNPYFEFNGGGSKEQVNKITIDFEKIPISKEINHVFFEGVKVINYSPRAYYGNTKFYFYHCIVDYGISHYIKYLVKPKETTNKELILYKNTEVTFVKCRFDTLAIYTYCGDSKWPLRHYPSFNHHFFQCDLNNCIIFNEKYLRTPITQPVENNLEFIQCNIKKLNISGKFTSLCFEDTKVNDFQATSVKLIEKKLKFIRSSFESPLNFPYLTLPDTAKFEMIKTSYQGLMKFPWDQLKDRIQLSIKKDVLKSYGNLYNLLKTNYKTLSLMKEADDSYFYWKQFERKNFWKLYWQELDTHWYNLFDVAKAIGLTIFNNVNYFSCGYGVKPLWIFPFTIFIVCLFALIYFFMPTRISNLEERLISKDKIADKLRTMNLKKIKEMFKNDDFNFKIKKQGLIEDILSSISTNELLEKLELQPKSRYNFDFFWYCFYFSFSTFTTIGIGDWYPSGKLNKAIVMLEGALGWLCLGLFITTYANILLR